MDRQCEWVHVHQAFLSQIARRSFSFATAWLAHAWSSISFRLTGFCGFCRSANTSARGEPARRSLAGCAVVLSTASHTPKPPNPPPSSLFRSSSFNLVVVNPHHSRSLTHLRGVCQSLSPPTSVVRQSPLSLNNKPAPCVAQQRHNFLPRKH